MKTIIELNENDLKDIIAKNYEVDKHAVNITTKTISVGYGMSEHDEATIVCYVSK